MPAAVAAPVARHGRNFRGPARRTVGLPPWNNSALLAGASARPDSHALVGLVGGPVRAAPAEPTANRRLRRCGRARLPCGRPPRVLFMQTRTTPMGAWSARNRPVGVSPLKSTKQGVPGAVYELQPTSLGL